MNKQLIFTFALAAFGMANSVFAAGVTVSVNGSVAEVTGTSAANHILIGQPWDGSNSAWVFDIDETGYNVCGVIDLDVVMTINVYGGEGNDFLQNDSIAAFVNLYGDAGDDELHCGELLNWFDSAEGGSDNDYIYAGNQGGYLLGGDGNDSIWANTWSLDATTAKTIVPGAGEDWVLATAQSDTIDAADGEFDYIDCMGGNDLGNEYSSADPFDELVNCDEGSEG